MDLSQSEVDALLSEAESLAAEVGGEPEFSEPRRSPPSDRPVMKPALKNVPPELRRILQIEVPVIVQLADRMLSMQEVLDLNAGSVIEFDKRFDAELSLFVSNRKVGLGHAVKVGENFGLRITRMGTIYDTIKALGS